METKNESSQFIDLVINRLQQCFKSLNHTIEQFKSTQKKSSLVKPIKKKSKEERIKEKARIPQPKSNDEELKQMRKALLTMSEEQKDSLRAKILQQKPKPPLNPFISYIQEQKERINSHSSKNLSIVEITAIASAQWKVLTEEDKTPYILEYQEQRAQYATKMANFMKKNPILKKLKLRKQPKKQSGNRLKISSQSKSQRVEQDSNGNEPQKSSSPHAMKSSTPSQANQSNHELFPHQLNNNGQNQQQLKVKQQEHGDRILIQSYQEIMEKNENKSKVEPPFIIESGKNLKLEQAFSQIRKQAAQIQKPEREFIDKSQQMKKKAKSKIMGLLMARKAEKEQAN